MFIAVPQLSSFQFQVIIFIITALSYSVQHLNSLLSLYREILKVMFQIHTDINGKVDRIKIKEFDFVVNNTFPFHIQIIYCILKICITFVFFYITLCTYFEFTDTDKANSVGLSSTVPFVFILISPAVLGLLCNVSNENKVASQYGKMKDSIIRFKNHPEMLEIPESSVICSCRLCCNPKGSRDSKGCFCLLIYLYDCLLGSCFRVDKNGFCYLCSYEEIKENNDATSDENAPLLQQISRQECYIYKDTNTKQAVIYMECFDTLKSSR